MTVVPTAVTVVLCMSMSVAWMSVVTMMTTSMMTTTTTVMTTAAVFSEGGRGQHQCRCKCQSER